MFPVLYIILGIFVVVIPTVLFIVHKRNENSKKIKNPKLPENKACRKKPCKNGTCASIGIDSYKCWCDKGWTGTNCDVASNCDPVCSVHGKCVKNEDDVYSCECNPGWAGTTCIDQVPICCAYNPDDTAKCNGRTTETLCVPPATRRGENPPPEACIWNTQGGDCPTYKCCPGGPEDTKKCIDVDISTCDTGDSKGCRRDPKCSGVCCIKTPTGPVDPQKNMCLQKREANTCNSEKLCQWKYGTSLCEEEQKEEEETKEGE
jgi:hypothetical protein